MILRVFMSSVGSSSKREDLGNHPEFAVGVRSVRSEGALGDSAL